MCALQCFFGAALSQLHPGESVPKQNYHHARKQRELARKTRQQAKQERRSARPGAPDENAVETPAHTPIPGNPVSGDGA